MTNAFAEIIESSLSLWKAQSWKWDLIPKFGSLVSIRLKNRIIFGIVQQIKTGSQDPYRNVITYKKTEDELKQEHPQIFELLQTTFECLTLGYFENGKFIYQLPSEPPKIHAFVHEVSNDELLNFFADEQYLHILFNFSSYIFSLDELLLALLKNLCDKDILTPKKLESFIEVFYLLSANDYRRLKLFLQRTKLILNANMLEYFS